MALFQWKDPKSATTWEEKAERLREHPGRWGCWVGAGELPKELASNKDYEWVKEGDGAYVELYGRFIAKKSDEVTMVPKTPKTRK